MARKFKPVPRELSHSFWGLIDTAIYPIFYMAIVPLFMKGLGTTGFSFWLIISTVMVILQLFNLNIGVTTMKKLAGYHATRRPRKANETLNAIFSIVFPLFILVLFLGSIMGFLAQQFKPWGLEDAPVRSLFECLMLAGMISGLKFFEQFFMAALKAKMMMKLSAILNILLKVGTLLMLVILAINGFSIATLLWANVVFSTIGVLVLLMVVIRFYPGYRPRFNFEKNMRRQVLQFSVWPWIQSLLVVIAFQTDRFWVSGYAGLDAVADYGLTATLFNHIHMIFTAMFVWSLPEISAIAARGDDPAPFYFRTRNALMLIVIPGMLIFHFLSPLILPLWIGEEHFQAMKDYVIMFTVFEILLAHTIMPYFFLNATGKERMLTSLTFVFCSASYLFMLLFLLKTGSLVAMIAGMALSLVLTMSLLNYMVRRTSRGEELIGLNSIKDMLPTFLAIGVILLPKPWSLLFILPLCYWCYRLFPQLKTIQYLRQGYGTRK